MVFTSTSIRITQVALLFPAERFMTYKYNQKTCNQSKTKAFSLHQMPDLLVTGLPTFWPTT